MIDTVMIEPQELTLTTIEALGLASRHDLANGHASQDLAPAQRAIVDRLPELWRRAARLRSADAERLYRDAFRTLAECPSLAAYDRFKICPTASNSIDTVATWLAEEGLATALIEPTFDNLYLILKRRGVQLVPLPEATLRAEDPAAALAATGAGAVFLVNPNNPTGFVLDERAFTAIVDACAANRQVLVLDNTFRFFTAPRFDMYRILIASGIRWLSIEDTGKVWPTQEIKASLLFTSPDLFAAIDRIYDEIFLCHSNFALAILTEFLLDAHRRGLANAVWQTVAERRALVRRALQGTALEVHPASLPSTLSVEWLRIRSRFASDLALVEHFRERNLVLLPGRQFYWSRRGPAAVTDSVRLALLKPGPDFLAAVQFIARDLRSVAP